MKKFIDKNTIFFLSLETKLGRFTPYLYIFSSSLLFSLMGLAVKFSKSIGPFQLIYTRTFINVLLCLCLTYYEKYDLISKNRITNQLLIKRGILGAINVMLYFYSLYLLPLSLVSTIMRITPLWIGVFGALFYKEPYKLKQFVATVACFIGVVIIFKPFSNNENEVKSEKSEDYMLGMVLLMSLTMLDSITSLTIRELRNKTNVLIIAFYFNFVSLIFSAVGCFFQPPKILTAYEWGMTGLISFFAFWAQLLSSRALFLEKAFMISIISYFGIVSSFIFDIFILNENIEGSMYLGMGIIILTMILLVLSERKK